MKQFSIMTALMLLLCTGCSAQEMQVTTVEPTTWQTGYQQVLREMAASQEGQFALIPLDGDAVPELLINVDFTAYLYRFNGTEAECIDEWEHLRTASPKMVSFLPGRETIAYYTFSMGTGHGYSVYLLQNLQKAKDRFWVFDMGYMPLEYMELDAEKFDIQIIDENFFELGETWVNGETDPDLLKDMTEENIAALDAIWDAAAAAYLTKE